MIKTELKYRIDCLNNKAKKILLLKLNHAIYTENNKRKDSRQQLVAYVQGSDSFEIDMLKKHLRMSLPEYMIPSSIISVDEIPTLPNGKIDKIKLYRLKNSGLEVLKKEVQDLSDTEATLSSIWEKILNFSPVDINDNFFEIGGDSILSIQIISEARKQGLMVSPNQLFEHQTIATLSQDIADKVNQEDKFDFLVPIRKEGSKAPLFCIHSGGGHIFFYNLLKEYMEVGRPIYALQPSGIDGSQENMHNTIEEMTTDYIKAMRAVQPKGPYNVLVYCFSATVGNEMAIQLCNDNEEVNIIVMDTMASPWTLNKPGRFQARSRSFFIRFFKNPIASIKTFFIDRFWRVSPIWIKLFGDENQKELENLKINLRKICLAYDWKEHSGKVSLILTEKPHESLQKVTIDSWKELSAEGRIQLYYTKGNHRTLFEEPDVKYVSEKIDEAMVD